MDPAAHSFLERACSLAREYDQEGRAILPNHVWPLILEDLGEQEDSDAAYFLMDHLKAAGDGWFSYMPLLEVTQSSPPFRGQQGGDAPNVQEPDRVESLLNGRSCNKEVIGEAFWARRGAAIQQLFTQWDCNQLSNEAFQAQLQAVLGDLVDVSSSESEFVRKTNQHRSARNLKFAELMSALRRDAQVTASRWEPEPSEAGSQALSHAAGRPTNSASSVVSSRIGRRPYPSGEDPPLPLGNLSQLNGATGGAIVVDRSRVEQQTGPDKPSYAPSEASDCHPMGGMDKRLFAGASNPTRPSDSSHDCRAGPDPSFWYRAGPPMATADDNSEVMSQSGVTDIASVAGSQRSEFTLRNRTGHGNILTWGSDSRSITPHKKRQGRQMTVDPSHGVPRSSMSSMGDIFRQPR